MFTQFRVRYPKGSLITELLDIDRGKYIVRALVQVEGVTLATGLAAADTVELAEDSARNRALAVLGISPTTATGEKEPRDAATELPVPQKPTPIPQTTFSQESLGQANLSPLFPETPKFDAASLSFSDPKRPEISLSASPVSWEPNAIPFADEFSPDDIEMPPEGDASEFETPAVMPPKPAFERNQSSFLQGKEGTPESQLNPPPVTPVPDYRPISDQAHVTGTPPTSEPVDLSDILARTTVELRRLGWGNEKGRDYVVAKYKKRSRTLLTNEELLEFLHYLESQPTPTE